MRLPLALLLAALAAACSSDRAATARAPAPAEGALLIENATVFGHPDADAILVENGKIKAVGPAAALRVQMRKDATVLDAKGGQVLPGFHDSHVHLMSAGMGSLGVDLSEYQTMDAALAALKAYADAHPADAWIVGRGWQYGIVPPGEFPTRQQLDAVVPDRPVFLRSYDGHSGWANTRALRAAGLTEQSVDPDDGRIVREADGKTPQGALLEGAMAKMGEAVPAPDRDTQLKALEGALQQMLQAGFTSVEEIAFDPSVFELLGSLEKAGRLPIRVGVSLALQGDLNAYDALRKQYASPTLHFGFLKGFLDGVIESRTAYMLTPYEGTAETGKPMINREELFRLVEQAHARGYQVALHSIGDAAVRMALDSYEHAIKQHPQQKVRHRVEHIEVIDPADLPRFKHLDVVASMQPFHANPGGPTPDDGVWSRNLGAARLKNTFAWRSLHEAGAPLAFGTDWPVMSNNPLWGLAMAMTRKDPNGQPPDGWNAHQTLSPVDAVNAYTRGSAYAVQREDQLGSIEVGKLADLVVLAPEVDIASPETLWKGKVEHVVVGGVVKR